MRIFLLLFVYTFSLNGNSQKMINLRSFLDSVSEHQLKFSHEPVQKKDTVSGSAKEKLILRDEFIKPEFPLLVINGVYVSYGSIDKTFTVEIRKITILDKPGSQALYGRDGYHGAIVLNISKRSFQHLRKNHAIIE